MKKLRIGMFFSLYFKAPHTNKDVIWAPMILMQQIAHLLTEHGHHVEALVAKDSRHVSPYVPSARFASLSTNALIRSLTREKKHAEKTKLSLLYNQSALKEFLKSHGEAFDILHLHHLDYMLPALHEHYPFATLVTIHDPISQYYQTMLNLATSIDPNVTPCFISDAQARAAHVRNGRIVHNGIDLSLYPYSQKPKEYLAFAGRLIQKKGILTAISVAQKTGKELRAIGDKPPDMEFWEKNLKPKLRAKNIRYRHTIPYEKMHTLYRDAKAILFPIQWDEPFGLVMVESMACGTPVVAFRRGSVPEIVKDGVTGFIVKNERGMAAAVKKIYAMPDAEYLRLRRACREHVEQNFSMERMVENYENLYYDIITQRTKNHANTKRGTP